MSPNIVPILWETTPEERKALGKGEFMEKKLSYYDTVLKLTIVEKKPVVTGKGGRSA